MEEMVKVGMLGILGVLLAVYFKQQKPEYGILIGCGIGLLIFARSVTTVEVLLDRIASLAEYLGNSGGYLAVLCKVLGITYVCEFSAGICKDAGFGALAGQIEIVGKLSVLYAGVPLVFAVMDQIKAF